MVRISSSCSFLPLFCHSNRRQFFLILQNATFSRYLFILGVSNFSSAVFQKVERPSLRVHVIVSEKRGLNHFWRARTNSFPCILPADNQMQATRHSSTFEVVILHFFMCYLYFCLSQFLQFGYFAERGMALHCTFPVFS